MLVFALLYVCVCWFVLVVCFACVGVVCVCCVLLLCLCVRLVFGLVFDWRWFELFCFVLFDLHRHVVLLFCVFGVVVVIDCCSCVLVWL